MTRHVYAAAFFAVAALVGCNGAGGELGQPCTLVKHNPDGGVALAVREGELPLSRSDYLSLGAPSCLEACVRDADFARSGDNDAVAQGYCSVACAKEGDSCGNGYSCKALLLDTRTIDALCTSEPGTCASFAGSPNPFFCVRSAP